MRQIGLLTLLIVTFVCRGQEIVTIKTEGQSIEEFVPKNWQIIRTAQGDLNKDNVEDAALVIQEMNPNNINVSSEYRDTLDSNPRILIVLLNDTATDKFRLIGVSRTFILSHQSRTMEDPFKGITISKGILEIGFYFWYSAGSWFMTTLEYKFRFQKNELTLIGAEFDQTDRGTMERIQRSFNFLTKKMSETISNEAVEDQKALTKWKNLDFKEFKTLRTLTRPLQWTILPNVDI
ncbi:MAG: hypothetical protein HYZ44_17855 [Bacteroidetes bacterium]|nr:hypothetical protein [Bacteroidota bacterium]